MEANPLLTITLLITLLITLFITQHSTILVGIGVGNVLCSGERFKVGLVLALFALHVSGVCVYICPVSASIKVYRSSTLSPQQPN